MDIDYWFTSDMHFGHRLMAEQRGFASIEEMDEALVKNWNERVKPSDTVYHLGDFSFHKRAGTTQRLFDSLNGHKHQIMGNHDKKLPKGWVSIRDAMFLKIKVPKRTKKAKVYEIYLHHYACRTWNKSHYGSWHLWGHSHGMADPFGKSFDCGTDCWGLAPINLSMVERVMDTFQIAKYTRKAMWDGLYVLQKVDGKQEETAEKA